MFDSTRHAGVPKHLAFIIECKRPDDDAGLNQLETYLANEPHARAGFLVNGTETGSLMVALYRQTDGSILSRLQPLSELPRPHEKISAVRQAASYSTLKEPSVDLLKRTVQRLLDKVVVRDTHVTRREEQLDQLCSIILLKLESDKKANAHPDAPPLFRPLATNHLTAEEMRRHFELFANLYPEVFTKEEDKRLRFNDDTLASCAAHLGPLKLLELGLSTVSTAFQVLRSEALKQGEGQYFTPQAVIRAGIKLLQIQWEDLVIDPACGTGGFLVETMLYMQEKNPNLSPNELSRWAQTHIHGIDKDSIGVKLTKATMQVAGDGSANCARGDAVRTHLWPNEFPHLLGGKFNDGRFSVVVTNPPFGQYLTVSADDCRLSGLDIARRGGDTFTDTEIGIVFLERSYRLLRAGGRLGIVLPETYFFSSNYSYLLDWILSRFRPVVVANVPMEAFQGFCRAKTNFYVFEKIR